VSESVAVLGILGSDRWNTDVYGSLTAASQVSSALKVGALKVTLAYSLHVLNGRLKNFFDGLYKAMDNPNPTSAQTPTAEQVQEAAATLRRLSAQLDGAYDRAKRCRLTNSSFWAGSLSRLHTYAEDLTELSDWLEMLNEPQSHEDIFKRAADEKEQGHVFSLSQVD
jgi:hypothetical protein